MNNNLAKNTGIIKNKKSTNKVNMFHIILIAIGIVSIVTTIIILIVHFTNQKQTYIVEYIPILTSGETNNMLVKYAMVTDKNLIEEIGKIKINDDTGPQTKFNIKYISKFPTNVKDYTIPSPCTGENKKIYNDYCNTYKMNYPCILCNKDFVKAWIRSDS